jgi:hypothetical protein
VAGKFSCNNDLLDNAVEKSKVFSIFSKRPVTMEKITFDIRRQQCLNIIHVSNASGLTSLAEMYIEHNMKTENDKERVSHYPTGIWG